MINVEPPQGEQDTTGFSEKSKDLIGAFEKVMTHALSTPSGSSTTPKEESHVSQTSVNTTQIPVNFSNKMPGHTGTAHHAAQVSTSPEAVYSNLGIQSKTAALNQTSSKTMTQTNGISNKDKKAQASTEPSSTPTTLETFTDQIFAIPVLIVDPIGKSGGEKTSKHSGSAVPSQTAVSEASATLPAASTSTNPASTATTKVRTPQLSASQMTPTVEPSAAAQQANASAAKELALPTKSIASVTPTQASPTAIITIKSSSFQIPESQITVGLTKPEATTDAGNATSQTSDSNTGAGTQPQSASNGTSIAKQDMSMKQAEKTNKIAGQNEKVLPGNAVYAARGSTSSLSTDSIATTVTATAGSSTADNVDGLSAPPADSVAVAVATNNRTSALERTQELVTVSAARLSDSGNNSMQVVIKPDSGTQLSLELRQRGGNVEVQAALQQGDFNHLNQQWPDLQHRLEEKGIRLAPLTDDGASGSNSGSETFQNKQNQSNEVVPEMTLVNAPAGMFTLEPAKTSVHQGWETWA
jgi:hypothetical protein